MALASRISALLFLVSPAILAGQTSLTLSGGPASWDLSGTGTGTTVALRWDRGLTDDRSRGPVALEVGLAWFQDGQAGQGAVDLLLPEAGLRIGLPGPFDVGAGAGWAIGLEDRSGDDLALWAALAADVNIGGHWSIRPELRLRTVDPWAGTIVDYGLGLRRTFRRDRRPAAAAGAERADTLIRDLPTAGAPHWGPL